MSDLHHHVQLTIEGGVLEREFVCTAPEDAPCRRRPKNFETDHPESWYDLEATVPGYPCWAREWIEAVGIEGGIICDHDMTLASIPVTIEHHVDGIRINPHHDTEAQQ